MTTTLADFVQQFIASRALHVSSRTIEWYHYTLDPLTEALGKRTLDQITTADLEAFLASQTPGRSKRTLQSFYTALRALFNFAGQRGYLTTNPTDPIQPPDPDRHRRRIPDYFTDAQIRQLLAVCQCRRDRAIVLTLLDTGLRRNELLELNVEDLDFQEGFLLVHGKGNKQRFVPFGQRCSAALQEYLCFRHPKTGALWRNRLGKRLRAGGLRSLLLRLKTQAGLECRVHPHKFRHTFARAYLEHGDLETLRAILGHEDIGLTSKVYACFLRSGIKAKHRRCSPVDHHQWEQATFSVEVT
jgi:integrase/recombinase XerC